jgi:hypothetical protein
MIGQIVSEERGEIGGQTLLVSGGQAPRCGENLKECSAPAPARSNACSQADPGHAQRGPGGPASREGTKQRQAMDAFRVVESEPERNQSAERVPDEMSAGPPLRIEKGARVSSELLDGETASPGRTRPETAVVVPEAAVVCPERGQLRTPAGAGHSHALNQQNRAAGSVDGVREAALVVLEVQRVVHLSD